MRQRLSTENLFYLSTLYGFLFIVWGVVNIKFYYFLQSWGYEPLVLWIYAGEVKIVLGVLFIIFFWILILYKRVLQKPQP